MNFDDFAIFKNLRGAKNFSREDLKKHMYIIGRSGMGKTTLLHNLALHLLLQGEGVVLIDPHGDLAYSVLDTLPPRRTRTTHYLDVTDRDYAVGFNPLAVPQGEQPQALAAANLVAAFRNVFPDSFGPRLEWFLYNGLALLIEQPGATLLDLPKLYYDKQFREPLTRSVKNLATREFWLGEYPSYNDRYREDAMGPILNKVGQFLASPAIRRILCQKQPKLDLARVLDNREVVVLNLSKGVIGAGPSDLLGSLFVSFLQTTVMARSALHPKTERTPFTLIVDEFQSFGTLAFAELLSEARKYGAQLVLAHQFTAQLDEVVLNAMLGSTSTLIAFRVGVEDAKLIAPEFHPLPFTELADQLPFQAWMKRPDLQRTVIETLPPQAVYSGRFETVKRQSRERFARQV